MDTWLIVLTVVCCAAPFLMVAGWMAGEMLALWIIKREGGWF